MHTSEPCTERCVCVWMRGAREPRAHCRARGGAALSSADSSFPGLLQQAPVKYTIADPASSPACDQQVQTFYFANTSALSLVTAAQSSPFFNIPAICDVAAATAGGVGNALTDGAVPVLWFGLSLAFTVLAALIFGFLSGRAHVKRQMQRTSMEMRGSYQARPLLDTM
ncbi:hypothetical protein EON67_08990 [archaeon]|nr:MAG: hypothetical protein EON67_08990 [archaeon]